MNKSERYNRALEFARLKHAGQKRIGGEDYITHPVAVAKMLENKGMPEDYLIAALFHDLLEDTTATEQEILALGGERVLSAVKLLTKLKGVDTSEYIKNIKSSVIAYSVKAMDRLHNLKCAIIASEEFKLRYAVETKKYYMEFDSQIPLALKALVLSMQNPPLELLKK